MSVTINHTQNSFNAGELSPLLLSRTDFEKYGKGCAVMENFIPTVQGPLIKRGGTKFVAEVNTYPCILINFTDTAGTSYILEIGENYVRFFKEDGTVIGAPLTKSIFFTLTEEGLEAVSYVQTGDVLYLVAPGAHPNKIVKNSSSDSDWSTSLVSFDWVPFRDENIELTALLRATATTGSISIVATGHSPFDSLDDYLLAPLYIKFRENPESHHDEWTTATAYVIGDQVRYLGRVYAATTVGTSGTNPPVHTQGIETDSSSGAGVSWEYLHDGEGYAVVTNYVSATNVTATVVKRLPDSVTSNTYRWAFASWSGSSGSFPSCVCIFEDRLIYGGSKTQPQRIWGSVTGDYENFKAGTNDDDSFQYEIGSQDLNTIFWMVPGKSLVLGCDNGEFVVSGSNSTEAITPTNIRVVRQTSYGSARHRPQKIGESILFVQGGNRKIREFTYNFDTESFVGIDKTILSEHITYTAIGNSGRQKTPYPIVWYPIHYGTLGDGNLIGLTYDRNENVTAFHLQVLGGEGKLISAAVIKKDVTDQLWLIVKRTIDGNEVYYVEYMEMPLVDGGSIEDAYYLDCGITYDSTATTTITGLDHLEGETVSVVGDGVLQADKTVSSGQITIDSASTVHVGYPYNANMQTMPLDPTGQRYAMKSRIVTETVRVIETGPGLNLGTDTTDLQDAGISAGLTSGLIGPVNIPGKHDRDTRMYVRHDEPFPCKLISITCDITGYDK